MNVECSGNNRAIRMMLSKTDGFLLQYSNKIFIISQLPGYKILHQVPLARYLDDKETVTAEVGILMRTSPTHTTQALDQVWDHVTGFRKIVIGESTNLGRIISFDSEIVCVLRAGGIIFRKRSEIV